MSERLVACTMGDPAGIGPEMLLRAAADLGDAHASTPTGCLFLGDAAVFAAYAGVVADVDPPVLVSSAMEARDAIRRGHRGPFLLECARVPNGFTPGRPRTEDGGAALASVMIGAEMAANREVDALVTAPLSKHEVARHAPGFKGHTEFLATLDGGANPTMVFAAPRNSKTHTPDIALLTTHLPLATALSLIRADIVAEALTRLAADWASCFGRAPSLGLAALNPHAGERGQIGSEEARVLSPAVRQAAAAGANVSGPYPADSIFQRADLDVILALYHDQGTIMAKRAPWPTVNLTLGLSYVRTSPDHGTAYELAGTGRADHGATLAAMQLAVQLAGNVASDVA